MLESDKASMDVPSPFSGTVVTYLVAEGDTVKVGDAIAELETADAVSDDAIQVTAEEPAEIEAPIVAVDSPAPDNASAPAVSSEQIALVPDVGNDDKVEVIEISVVVGDQVEEGDTLIVLESDKATMDVPSTLTGTVKQIIAKEGDKLGTADQVAVIEVTQAAEVTQPQVQPVVESAPTVETPY